MFSKFFIETSIVVFVMAFVFIQPSDLQRTNNALRCVTSALFEPCQSSAEQLTGYKEIGWYWNQKSKECQPFYSSVKGDSLCWKNYNLPKTKLACYAKCGENCLVYVNETMKLGACMELGICKNYHEPLCENPVMTCCLV